jgi:hypothetical protein
MKKLHDQYGPVVRIGPNLVDLDYPELIKTIYSTDEAWRKVGPEGYPRQRYTRLALLSEMPRYPRI